MFTGLVQAVGEVVAVRRLGRGQSAPVRLTIDPGSWEHRPGLGESISVSGACLTVAARRGGRTARQRALEFDVVPETLAKTTLGSLGPGSRVNLEHSLTLTTLVGGHLVQGHVDGVGRVVSVRKGKGGVDWRVRVRLPRGLEKFLVAKGSVCVEGVSLTIAKALADGFEVALIPTTLGATTLSELAVGDRVNIETDMIVKTVVACVERMGRVPPTVL